MSSKRKAASGPAMVAADSGDAHTAKRRKLPVSPAIADIFLSTLLVVDGLVVGWKKLIEQRRHLSTRLFARLDWTRAGMLRTSFCNFTNSLSYPAALSTTISQLLSP